VSRLVACRRSPILCSIAWLLVGFLAVSVALAGETTAPPRTGFDRAALDEELSRPIFEVRRQGPEALRSHVQRLIEFHASLDLTQDVSPGERRALTDRILGRVAQVGLIIREGGAEAVPSAKTRGGGTAAILVGALDSAVGFLGERSLLVIGLLGGVIIAYSLGRLAGYRRGASEASYYGAGDPRLWFVTRAREGTRPVGYPIRITLDQIRKTLASGRTVLMQLGYEIAPERRREFLRLVREMQRVLNEVGGQVHSVWEDPRHPNRFYEVVVCHRLEDLDLLTSERSELAGLDAEIEACWLPGRPVLRRAWWGVFPERAAAAPRLVAAAPSGHPREDRVS